MGLTINGVVAVSDPHKLVAVKETVNEPSVGYVMDPGTNVDAVVGLPPGKLHA